MVKGMRYAEMKKWASIIILSAGIGLFVAGCSDKEEAEKTRKPLASKQVEIAAKVNDTKITVEQVNEEIQKMGVPVDTNPEVLAEIKNDVLARLVNNQLLMDKAIEQKVNRQPEVASELEKAKREIVTRAYIAQLVTEVSKPTEEELDAFYTKNEDGYKANVRYIVYQLIARFDQSQAALIQEGLKKSSSLVGLTKWFSQNQILTMQQTNIVDTATLSPEMRQQLSSVKIGQLIVQSSPTEIMITEVLRAEVYPITRADLDTVAAKQIADTRRNDILQNQIKALREGATIEYSSGFAAAKTAEEFQKMVQGLGAPGNGTDTSATTESTQAPAPVTSAPAQSAASSSAPGATR